MRKAVIVISSHVARGSVGNRAAVFALETLGIPVWAIPTVTLPWHPGHGPSTRIIPQPHEFEAFLSDIARAPWIAEVGAVLSGYMASDHQANRVARLVAKLKQQNPDLVYLCDPVIGDHDRLYVDDKTALAVKNDLLPLADITTPNFFELGWLCNKSTPKELSATLEMARAMAPECVIATSCETGKPEEMGNLLVSSKDVWLARHPVLEKPPKGPGDLTAAIFLGHRMAGMRDIENLTMTTASVFELLTQSAKRRSDELTLETDAKSIQNPEMEIILKELR